MESQRQALDPSSIRPNGHGTQMMTVAEAAEILAAPPQKKIGGWCQSGVLDSIQIGRKHLIAISTRALVEREKAEGARRRREVEEQRRAEEQRRR